MTTGYTTTGLTGGVIGGTMGQQGLSGQTTHIGGTTTSLGTNYPSNTTSMQQPFMEKQQMGSQMGSNQIGSQQMGSMGYGMGGQQLDSFKQQEAQKLVSDI